MKALTLVMDNDEISTLYNVINHYINYGYNADTFDRILHRWKREMERHYNTRERHCIVFDLTEFDLLSKMSICYLKGDNLNKEKRSICTDILHIIKSRCKV